MKKFTVEISKYTNCCCNICHRLNRVAKIRYYTQDYRSNKRKGKICENLQKHPHEIWICEKCMDDLKSEWIRSTRGLGWNYHEFYGGDDADSARRHGEGVLFFEGCKGGG